MHHLVIDYCFCFFKYIHGFTRKILKNSILLHDQPFPGRRWILSNFLLNAGRFRSVIFPLGHVALDFGSDRRWIWVQRRTRMRLLQSWGLTAVVAQELLASFFQNADVCLVPGLLEGKSEKHCGQHTAHKCMHAARPVHWLPERSLAVEDWTSFPKWATAPGADGFTRSDEKGRQNFSSSCSAFWKNATWSYWPSDGGIMLPEHSATRRV